MRTRAASAGVFYDGVAVVDNQGTISADAVSLGGSYGAAEAVGVGFDTLFGKYNLPEVIVANSGEISASATRHGDYGYASATGVSVMAMLSELYNTGSIDAVALGDGYYSGADAVGVLPSPSTASPTSTRARSMRRPRPAMAAAARPSA
jgi:hypothetical protein